MSDYSGIERLLGVPIGSTKGKESDIAPILVNGIANKTKDLVKQSKTVQTLEDMDSLELIKNGFSIEQLQRDKLFVKTETREVYNIGKSILSRFKTDLDQLGDVNDRMYASGAKLLESVSVSLEKLSQLLMKLEQQSEMKQMSETNNTDDGKEMSPHEWIRYIQEVKRLGDTGPTQEAEIIPPDEHNT